MRNAVNYPDNRSPLHPHSYARNKLAEKKQCEIAAFKSPECILYVHSYFIWTGKQIKGMEDIIGKLFFIFFLKTDTAHNTDGRNTKKKNNHGQYIAAIHFTCFEQYISNY